MDSFRSKDQPSGAKKMMKEDEKGAKVKIKYEKENKCRER
jgi:hypothetical protein